MPNIGQAFSTPFLNLIVQRQEAKDDRNLRAAIAERELADRIRERSMKVGQANAENMLRFAQAKESGRQFDSQMDERRRQFDLTQQGQQSEAARESSEFDRTLEFKTAQEERKARSDEALSKKREAETYRTLLLTDPEAAALWAKSRQMNVAADIDEASKPDELRRRKGVGNKAIGEGQIALAKGERADEIVDKDLENVTSQIKSRERAIELKGLVLQHQKDVAAAKSQDERIRIATTSLEKYISMLSKFDPVFGAPLADSNSVAADYVKDRIAFTMNQLVAMGKEPDKVMQAADAMGARRMGAARGGNDALEKFLESIAARRKELEDKLRNKGQVNKPNLGN